MFDDFQPNYVTPTPEQVLMLLRDWHRQSCLIECGEEPLEELSMDTTVRQWRAEADMVGWRELG